MITHWFHCKAIKYLLVYEVLLCIIFNYLDCWQLKKKNLELFYCYKKQEIIWFLEKKNINWEIPSDYK